MALSVKSLNGDSSFLLTFSPPAAPASSPGLFPGSFTILIDPWLTGGTQILHPKFSLVHQKAKPCITSLAQLPTEPDLILISQDKPDHCNRETLCQLDADTAAIILATPPAARKIRSWNHFDPDCIVPMQRFEEAERGSVFRLELPAFSPSGHPGELTISWMPMKRDLTASHHAIGITYRPPSSVLSSTRTYIDLPPTPPASPQSPRTIYATPKTLSPSPLKDREKTFSVIYSPHGVPYDVVRPYAASHLVEEAALPLNLLIHAFDVVQMPWYMGGNIATGASGGVDIARNLLCRNWIAAHDADKEKSGITAKLLRIDKHEQDDIRRLFDRNDAWSHKKSLGLPNLVMLQPGQEHRATAT